MIDYHIHPGFSIDAEEYSIDDYCRRAVEIGLREICFTPHYEFDPLRKEIDWWVRYNGRVMSIEEDWLSCYIEEVRRAAEIYAPFGLTVKAGLEVGFAGHPGQHKYPGSNRYSGLSTKREKLPDLNRQNIGT